VHDCKAGRQEQAEEVALTDATSALTQALPPTENDGASKLDATRRREITLPTPKVVRSWRVEMVRRDGFEMMPWQSMARANKVVFTCGESITGLRHRMPPTVALLSTRSRVEKGWIPDVPADWADLPSSMGKGLGAFRRASPQTREEAVNFRGVK